jgi:hypothetical protein
MKLRRWGVSGGAALLAAAMIVPATGALADTPTTVTDQYGAAASGEVLDLHLLGRHISFGQAEVQSTLDAVTKNLTAEAKGVATMLVPAASAIARFNDASAPGGKACAAPQVADLLGIVNGTSSALPALPVVGGLSIGGLLPKLDMNIGCGEATVAGSIDQGFVAESVGGLLSIKVGLPQALQDLVGTLRGTLNGVLGQSGLTASSPLSALTSLPVAGPVVSQVNNLLGAGGLGSILGGLPIAGPAAAPITNMLDLNTLAGINPTQTIDGLLNGLENGDLVRISLGAASARNAGDAKSYLSQAIAEGGEISILPDMLGAGKSLVKITVAKSDAKVLMGEAGAAPQATATNTLIRVESALLSAASGVTGLLSGVPVVGGLVGSTGLPAVESVVGTVGGLLGGVPVVGNLLGLDATVKGLGLTMGDGYVELAPGMSVSILCDGLLNALCSEISVGAVKPAEVLANGRTRIESSTATIHLFKGLNDLGLSNLPVVGGAVSGLVGGLNLGTILGNDGLLSVINPLLGTAGLNLGEASDVPGIKLSIAHAVAEAGGAKVMGAFEEKARELGPVAQAPAEIPALPRTGGLPIDATAIPMLLGASAGLAAIARRRRKA